jgi:hypothetical protein
VNAESEALPLELSGEERQVLEGWTRRRTTAQALALRSRIVLECLLVLRLLHDCYSPFVTW